MSGRTAAALLFVTATSLVLEVSLAGPCSQTELLDILTGGSIADIWYPEPCTRCSCALDGDSEECVTVQCAAPDCQQDEMLTFNSTACCPTCEPKYRDCQLNGVKLKHGSSHRSAQCEQCDCIDGELDCHILTCSQVECSSRIEDDCCRKCSNSMCEDDGKLYPDKSTWNKENCVLCECERGDKSCYAHVCPPLDCQLAYTPDGACCPICPNDQCWSNGRLYETGETWEDDSCTNCVCISGKAKCFTKDCFESACPRQMRPILEPGACCPTCFPEYGTCMEGDNTYYNGQIWNVSKCEFCSCLDGRISCSKAQCSHTTCPANSYLDRDEDACCPVCKLKEACLYDGKVRLTKMWEAWEVNSCKLCLCQDSMTQCYENSCPSSNTTSADSLSVNIISDVFVTRRGSTVISTANIQITAKSLDDVRLKVIQGPEHGVLHNGHKEFSYRELSDGLLYQHDGSAGDDDFALLQVSDEGSLQNVLLPIDIQSSDKLAMVNNAPLLVEFGQQEMITLDNLLYEAGGDDTAHLLEYQITVPPRAGSVLMVVAQTEESGLNAGWTALPDGTMFTKVTEFRQTDINQGYIFYQHQSEDTDISTDTFTFQVTFKDTADMLADQIFTINILPAKVYNAPSVAPGSSLGLTAFEGATVTLTPAYLSFVDADTMPTQIVYDVTHPLPEEYGIIEYIADPEVPITMFTQQDIDSGLLAYRTPTDLEVGLSQPTYSFKFNVSDNSGNTVTEQQFNILILPVDDQPPTVPSVIAHLNVERGSSVLISDSAVGVTDVDTAKEDLEFSLITQPQHGDIVKLDDDFHTVLRQDDKYSYDEILSNTLYYVHDNTETLEDSVTFRISDSTQSVDATIPVTIQYSDNAAPTLSPGATMKVRLNEGERAVITTSELEFEDTSTDGLVLYQIASEPQFGRLLYETSEELKLGDGFAQSDILSRRISYEADAELGNLEIMDTVYLNVSDTAGNMAAMQPLAISIKASDNAPPSLIIGSDLTVAEGRRKQLTKSHIAAEDPDSILTNIMVMIDSVPTLGNLKIITQDGLERGIRESQVHMFLLTDLYAGIVYYEQTDHLNKEPRSDFFWLHLSDGQNISPVARFNITILPQNDEPPSIVADTVFVEEGETIPLTNSSLYVSDIDTEFDGQPADTHTFTLIKSPREGQLQYENKTEIQPGTSFTMQDVLNGMIFYSHNGREDVSQDSFTVSVTDGYYDDTEQVPVDIALLDDETPRVKINDGLKLKAGGELVIDSSVLHATDIDSDDDMLLYSISQPVTRGKLYRYMNNDTEIEVRLFTPLDLKDGSLMYRNYKTANQGGFDYFIFDVIDENDNKLIDQTFYIDVMADTTVPTVRVNSPLSVQENSFGPITTSHLYITDPEATAEEINVRIDQPPQYGNIVLEDDSQTAKRIEEFTMADLIAHRIFYVHESEEEVLGDSFKFTATDGTHNISQTFRIRLIPVDDSLPVLTYSKMIVEEGEDKPITEFDIKVTDNDTSDDMLLITLIAPPEHGNLVLTRNGEEIDTQCLIFSMADIYNGDLTYKHDNTESTSDSFTFAVTDQTNDGFFLNRNGQLIRTSSPLTMEITIQLVDDGVPHVLVNKGIPYMETSANGKISAKIRDSRLRISDPDTSAESVIIKMTRIPRNGVITLGGDNSPVSQFTQDDIDNALVTYTLSDGVTDTDDSFEFSVMDSAPNTVSGLTFNIRWSYVELGETNITATEDQAVIEIPVMRRGSTSGYSAVSCELDRSDDQRHHSANITVLTKQIQFAKGDKSSLCRISIRNDTVYRGLETFSVKLSSPDRTLLGEKNNAVVSLTDAEDEPVIELTKLQIITDESSGTVSVPLTRSGDVSEAMTVLCSTKSQTAIGSSGNRLDSGTDFISQSDMIVKFKAGEKTAACEIRIIDDTLFEGREEFEVSISNPSEPAKLGLLTTSTVIIAGPNDASDIQMADSVVEVYEDEKVIAIDIIRHGLDLNKPATVWCTTNILPDDLSPATPSKDYIPVSRKISFVPGQSRAICEVSIVDDEAEPVLEGPESFSVTLTTADLSSVIGEKSSTHVIIDDSDLDIPMLSFETGKYNVDETAGSLSISIIRTGDISCPVSVICYTRQQTAGVMADYIERPLNNESRVEMIAGQRVGSCDLEIVDDTLYEASEFLLVRLAEPLGCGADVGDLDVTLVTVQDPEDEPLLSFGSNSYSINEPESQDEYVPVKLTVHRKGDISKTAEVRVSTRDKSAVSGIDYSATSQLLYFMPNESSQSVDIRILYNFDVEWHETFVVVLEEPIGASLGDNKTTIVNILDTDIAGSLVLPTLPIVVSLIDYESGEVREATEVSPAYPLICLSPCDPLYPAFAETEHLCIKSNINTSAMTYSWEVSYPVLAGGGRISSYLGVNQDTLYSRVNTMMLETFYFRAGFNVRCVATPISAEGLPGVPIRSSGVSVHSQGVCSNPVIPNSPGSLSAQSFIASLEYIKTNDDDSLANKIHITVEIPHQDGMLPIISTMPIYNIDFLLSQPAFTKQHVCSNLPNTSQIPDLSLLGGDVTKATADLPRVEQAIKLYRHLDMATCRWKFEAWYDLSEIVDQCGGYVTHNFDVESSSQSFVTVHQPLHVSYIFAKAPTGWASLDHQTQLEFSFYYDTVKFQSGVDIVQEPEGSVDILRVGIGEDGKLVLQLRTQARFKGLFVTDHYTAKSSQTSGLIPPENLSTRFSLKHVWTQPTLDSPVQIWRATSRYSLQDYTGTYTLRLLACVAGPTQTYDSDATDQKCAVQEVLNFPLSIAFQQSNRPVSARYSLATQLQLTNNKRFFLTDPQSVSTELAGDFHGVFDKGDRLFGRVFWDPSQDLESAFRLQLDKVFICAGRDGFTPSYDPTGKIYNEGPQYGCLEPSGKLKHRFLILDRGQEEVTTKVFNGLAFKAYFADGMQALGSINDMSGTDGFVMSVDPLFSLTSGQRWHVHVLYRIGSADSLTYGKRRRRAATDQYQVGTNLIMINLKPSDTKQDISTNRDILENRQSSDPHPNDVTKEKIETKIVTNHSIIVVLIIVIVLVLVASVGIVYYVKRKTNIQQNSSTSTNCDTAPLPPPNYHEAIRHITLNKNSEVVGTAV